jgi:hypothetical protein
MRGQIGTGQIWRHRRRNSYYEIMSVDAAMQCSSFGSVGEKMEALHFIAYRAVNDFKLFFRPRDEFLDGRFEFIKGAE